MDEKQLEHIYLYSPLHIDGPMGYSIITPKDKPMSNERDTHFAGFAKLLWQEINDKGKFNIDMEASDTDETVTSLIAQRAYDLVLHTVWNTASSDLQRLLMTEVAAKIPDLTEFTDTSQTDPPPS